MWTEFLTVALWIFALFVLIPIAVVTFEVIAALCAPDKPVVVDQNISKDTLPAPKTVVLIPAHNEESGIASTLSSIGESRPENCRVLCVAHNCTDGTAEVARNVGAEVVEIQDAGTGGKPDAIKGGLSALDTDPPDVVVVIDADCRVALGTIADLATRAYTLNTPVMGSYTFSPAGKDLGMGGVSSLAILLKNHIRPLGLHALGLPCLLNGSGSAYPFALLRHAPHGEGSIAEDYQLTIDLLRQGYPTRFVSQAQIHTALPHSQATAFKQRQRWEHGHLWLSFRTAPALLWEGLLLRDWYRCAVALEIAVPPLAFLLLLWFAALALCVLAYLARGKAAPLVTISLAGVVFSALLITSWLRFAGREDTLAALASVPRYILWKLPLYGKFFTGRETRWLKTDRDASR